jgi:hypothetical protein
MKHVYRLHPYLGKFIPQLVENSESDTEFAHVLVVEAA